MSLRDTFRTLFGFDGEEYTLDAADIPTTTVAGETFPLLGWIPSDVYVETLPPLKRGRQMLADTVASLPPVAFRKGIRLSSPPALVRRPDPAQSPRVFVEETVLSLIDFGNAYWFVTYDDARNQPIAAKVLDPERITVYWDATRTTRLYLLDSKPVSSRNIRHLALQRSPRDEIGSGPLQSTRLAGLVYMLRYSSEYFKEASNPSGILTDPFENDPDEAGDKLGVWEAGADRGTRFLSGGMTWTPNTMKPGESDWVDSHAAGYADIATLLGIPAPLLTASNLGQSTSIIYQNVVALREQWHGDSLNVTWIPRIEEAWSSLLPRGITVELDTDAWLRPSLKDRVGIAAEATAGRLISVDEARTLIGYDTDGDLPTAPANPSREVANA